MDTSQSSSSSDSSFVLVDQARDGVLDLSLLSSLAPFFPSISQPSAFAWDYKRIEQVKGARSSRPDGRLFIDELLSLVDLDGQSFNASARSQRRRWSSRAYSLNFGAKFEYSILLAGPSVYPPSSASALNTLLFTLLTSTSHGLLKSRTIIFYLLLADSESTLTSTPSFIPTAFARDFLLPTGFVRGVEGFHACDAGAWRSGVAALTDPHLTPDFISKTLSVLSALPPVKERAGLVLSYWRLGGIALEGKEEVGLVIDALCDQERKFGVVEAWGMQRKWGDEAERNELAVRVLAGCFGRE
jgi:hypothetical protein